MNGWILLAVALVVLVGLPMWCVAVVWKATGGGTLSGQGTVHEVPAWAHVAPEQIAEARKHDVPVAFENELGMRFVLIPAGTFVAGSLRPTPWGGDRREHEATVTDPFYLQTTEVTNAQYRRFAPGHSCSGTDGYDLDRPEQPACGMTWREAVAFARWAQARLPTEVEWERAARGGLVGRRWPWGDEWKPHRVNAAGDEDGYGFAAPVASFAPNRYGLYDMAGNVAEWCSDPWDPRQDDFVPEADGFPGVHRLDEGGLVPLTAAELQAWKRTRAEEARLPHRVVRGGGWLVPDVACARRFGLAEVRRRVGIGLRLVVPLPER